MTTVNVYSKKPCPQCDATFRKMDQLGIPYRVHDATDPENLRHIKSLGFLQAPVVQAGAFAWAGYSPDKINALAQHLKEQP
jgi:glutaredoxin-like protein NrdH